MNLGFSFGAAPAQAVQSSSFVANESVQTPSNSRPQNQLLARTAALAAQIGGGAAFLAQYVSRTAILPSGGRNTSTFDEKRAKNIIRKLKVEATESSNDHQRPDK